MDNQLGVVARHRDDARRSRGLGEKWSRSRRRGCRGRARVVRTIARCDQPRTPLARERRQPVLRCRTRARARPQEGRRSSPIAQVRRPDLGAPPLRLLAGPRQGVLAEPGRLPRPAVDDPHAVAVGGALLPDLRLAASRQPGHRQLRGVPGDWAVPDPVHVGCHDPRGHVDRQEQDAHRVAAVPARADPDLVRHLPTYSSCCRRSSSCSRWR